MKQSAYEKVLDIQMHSLNIRHEHEFQFHKTRKWRFDFVVYVGDQRYAVEIDGGQWQAHGGRHMTPGDYEKRRAAACLGWRVLPFLGSEVNNNTAIDFIRGIRERTIIQSPA